MSDPTYWVIVVRQDHDKIIWTRTSRVCAGAFATPQQQLEMGLKVLERQKAEAVRKDGLPYWQFLNRLEGR